MKMGRSSRLDESTSSDDHNSTINVGMHRVSSRVEPDGSAEAMLSNTTSPLFASAPMARTLSAPLGNSSIPMSRAKSTPLGGMTYAMKRVLSRDNRERQQPATNTVSEQESEGLVSSRVKGVYNRGGGVETVLDDRHLLPPPLVRKSSLSSAYSMRKVFSKSKQGDEWQSGETDEFLRSNSDNTQESDISLKGGYGLRQVNSTPLQGVESGYALKRMKTCGYEQQQHQQSSLYEEERMHNPISLVRSRLSSAGQTVTGGKEVGKGKGNGNDDDLSTIAESITSSSPSTASDFRQKKKKKWSKYFVYQLIFAAMMISSGIAGAGVYLLKAGDNETVDVSTVVVAAGESGEVTNVVEESSGSSVDKGIGLKMPEVIDVVVEEESKSNEALNEDVIVEESNEAEVEAPAGDEILLNAVDAKPESELEDVVSELAANSATVGGDVGKEETADTINANDAADIVDETISTPKLPSPTEDVLLELTNSTANGVGDAEATSDTINAADVTTDIEDQTIPATNLPATTTTPPSPPNTITNFYVMADAPYTDEERQILMPKHIEELSDYAEFLVHLGDLQWAKVDKCREGAYDEASTIMQKSRIPTFILPGDNDINDCNSMTHGEEMWTKYFALFDKRYEHSLNVTRWGKLNESFSFMHKEVLFLGLNIIGGRPASNSEKTIRHSQHLERIRAIMNDHFDEFKVVVLLGHAEPASWHSDFFGGDAGFISMIKEMGKPTIHFHGDWHAYYEREAEYGVANYMRVSLDGESRAPPILVTIDTSKQNPVKFSRRSDNLAVACCSEGWPRYDGKVVNTPRPN